MASMVHELAADAAVKSPVTPEAKAAFDYTCQYYLQVSGQEFLRRYDAGEYNNSLSDTKLIRVLAMLPFAR